MEERLQKLISSCGLASRRTAEAWITAGRIWTGTGWRWTASPSARGRRVHT